jgi:hypothetical protein
MEKRAEGKRREGQRAEVRGHRSEQRRKGEEVKRDQSDQNHFLFLSFLVFPLLLFSSALTCDL